MTNSTLSALNTTATSWSKNNRIGPIFNPASNAVTQAMLGPTKVHKMVSKENKILAHTQASILKSSFYCIVSGCGAAMPRYLYAMRRVSA
jgi:hypothetical protein